MEQTLFAICIMNADNNSGVNGVVKFEHVKGQKCKVTAEIDGLKKGLHGFHVHEFGNLIEGCKSAGGHYNPKGMSHGGPTSEVRHVGDLGNIDQPCEKGEKATFLLEDTQVSLWGEESVIGRSCVCHADEDDLGQGGQSDSLTTGHAGARLACGVIALSAKF